MKHVQGISKAPAQANAEKASAGSKEAKKCQKFGKNCEVC